MKQISINIDDETVEQMSKLAELWGLPEVRHNSAVVMRCVERVWMVEMGVKEYREDQPENSGSIDNAS